MRLGVVPTIGIDASRSSSRATRLSSHAGNGVDQGEELCDVVTVRTGQSDREGDPVAVGDQVVFAAWTPPIDWAWPGFFPPRLVL